MKITICASMAFYKDFIKLKKDLEEIGHIVLVPELEFETNSEDTSVGFFFEQNGGVKSFEKGHNVWIKKGNAIKAHFRKIDESEAVLIVNNDKKGQKNYIGANTFLEIGYAFATNKKIFLLNKIPEESVYLEEIMGINPVELYGEVRKISL